MVRSTGRQGVVVGLHTTNAEGDEAPRRAEQAVVAYMTKQIAAEYIKEGIVVNAVRRPCDALGVMGTYFRSLHMDFANLSCRRIGTKNTTSAP